MSAGDTFRIGTMRCHAIDAGRLRLDGGAMFGVVPKARWERRAPADGRNRISLALRSLLVEHPDGPVLVETGVGNKESSRFIDIYGVENVGEDGRTTLEDSLVKKGFTPADIKYVINTHLHFDHAGGNTVRLGEGDPGGEQPEVGLSFPNATYVVQRGELEFARTPNERTVASYLRSNFEPVAQAGRWRLVEGDAEVLPGVRVLHTPGHVPHHQSVCVSDGGETICFIGDLVPTAAHLPLPWIMGYDLHPLVTLETKRRVLERAASDGWLVAFPHEPGPGIGHVVAEEGEHRFEPLDTPETDA